MKLLWTRRQLGQVGAAALLCLSPGCKLFRKGNPYGGPALLNFPEDEAYVLRAVVDRILPKGPPPLPGGLEVGVATYIDRALSEPAFVDLLGLVKRGLKELTALSRSEKGAPFFELRPQDQDALLLRCQRGEARFATTNEQRLFMILWTLSLEGYLGAPKHGGNQNGAVWKALGFDPEQHGHGPGHGPGHGLEQEPRKLGQ